MSRISREQAMDMSDAHAEGYHSPPEIPREGCPDCEDRPLRSYPTKHQLRMARLGLDPYTTREEAERLGVFFGPERQAKSW
jgi:hypothetical protein